jgi:effector-binding domain-containing protein
MNQKKEQIMKWCLACVLVLVGFFTSQSLGQLDAGSDTEPSTQPAPLVGSEREQFMIGFNFVYTVQTATIPTISQVAGTEVPKLFDAIKQAGIQQRGPVVFIYPQMSHDMSKPFQVQIGMMVEPGGQAPDGYQMKFIPAANCAAVLYAGDMKNIGQAYRPLFEGLTADEKTPTGETRQYFLYFEGDQSMNNIVLVTALDN